MVPTIAQQLSAVLRALQEVILPALDLENKLATQQLHMCTATLRMIAAQCDQAYHIALTELRLYTRFVQAVRQGDCTGIEASLRARLNNTAADRWSQFKAPQRAAIDSVTCELRELADALVVAPSVRADRSLHTRVMTAVSELSRDEAVLRRAWMAAMGTDPEPQTLPSIDELIAPTVASTTER